MDKLVAILLLASAALSSSNAIEGKTVLVNPLLAIPKAGTVSKLQGRQACNVSDLSVVCNNTLAQLNTLIYQARIGDPNDISTSTVTTLLDQFCASECLPPVLRYLNCLGEVLVADFYNTGFCGESDGTYCLVVWLNGYSDGIQLLQTTCGQSSPCDQNCKQTLQETVNYLGCCAASLYGNTDPNVNLFSSMISPSQFTTCGVSLGESCEGAENSAVANEVRFGLLVVFVTSAILAML